MKYGIYTLIIENILSKSKLSMFDIGFDYGWGTGYVLLPPNHPFYGKDYDNINDVRIHGGLTFAQKFEAEYFLEWIGDREFDGDITLENYKNFDGYWMIGFDTNHYGDNSSNWTKKIVMNETNDLLEQCLDEGNKDIKKYKNIILRRDKLRKVDASIFGSV